MSLRVYRAALEITNGFTHYPQNRETWRIFPGDPLPSRIIVVDGDGSITLDAIDWVTERGIPLLRLNYRGRVASCMGTAPEGRGIDPRLADAQRTAAADNLQAMALATRLVREKLTRSRTVVEELMPESPPRTRALERLATDAYALATPCTGSLAALLGIEGMNAADYFWAMAAVPLIWKGTGRHPIPERWRTVGPRSTRGEMSNRFDRHPVQAMREREPRRSLTSQPTGTPSTAPERSALVLDLMEPLRPEVDRQVIQFLRRHKLEPADVIVFPSGECRLHPTVGANVGGGNRGSAVRLGSRAIAR